MCDFTSSHKQLQLTMLRLVNEIIRGMNRTTHWLLLLALLTNEGGAFAPGNLNNRLATARIPSPLLGIAEWRDLPPTFGEPEEKDGELFDGAPLRRLPLMLVNSEEVVLQGEKKCFQFTRYDELRIFQRAVDYNQGIFGLGLVSEEDEAILERILLMEILDSKMDLGVDYGIFCEAKVVGRATILKVVTAPVDASTVEDVDKEPVTVICAEYFDKQEECYGLDDAVEMASRIMAVITDLSGREEATFPSCQTSDDDDNDDNDENEENETRIVRFHQAIHAAYESDSQGYVCPTEHSRKDATSATSWSWKEVNAISWAAFSSSLTPKMDATYRLHAMDMQLVSNRLQLATYWLADVLSEVDSSR